MAGLKHRNLVMSFVLTWQAATDSSSSSKNDYNDDNTAATRQRKTATATATPNRNRTSTTDIPPPQTLNNTNNAKHSQHQQQPKTTEPTTTWQQQQCHDHETKTTTMYLEVHNSTAAIKTAATITTAGPHNSGATKPAPLLSLPGPEPIFSTLYHSAQRGRRGTGRTEKEEQEQGGGAPEASQDRFESNDGHCTRHVDLSYLGVVPVFSQQLPDGLRERGGDEHELRTVPPLRVREDRSRDLLNVGGEALRQHRVHLVDHHVVHLERDVR